MEINENSAESPQDSPDTAETRCFGGRKKSSVYFIQRRLRLVKKPLRRRVLGRVTKFCQKLTNQHTCCLLVELSSG